MISIAVGTNIFYLPVDDIYYIKAESNYIRVFTIEGRIFLIARTLKKAAGTLIHNGFIRVHHSYLLHPRHIRAYYPGERLIHLSNQEQIPVSRSNCSRVKAYLAAHAL